MARTIVIVRHGKAQTRSEDRVDFERTLTEAGKRSLAAWLPRSMRLLAKDSPASVAIWSSPAARALETAGLVADAYAAATGEKRPEIEEQPFLWEQDVYECASALKSCPADTVFIVGHNPFCGELAALVCDGVIPLATGAVVALRIGDSLIGGAHNSQLADALSAFAEGADVPVAGNAPAEDARLLWMVQGPESKRWKTVCELEKVIAKAAANVETRLATFLEKPEDVEAAHKVRVSIRTLRGLLAFVKPFQQSEQNKRMNADLRENVVCTSRLRELDVLCEQVAQLEPAAEDLLAACVAQRESECAKTISALTSKEATKRFARVARDARALKWKRSVEREGLSAEALPQRFADVSARIEADLEALDLADVERTHDVRKRAKQVRYAAEQFGHLVGPESSDVATSMEQVQDRLGALCDARVNVDLVDSFPRKGLSERAVWDLMLLRAQNETFIFNALRMA